MKIPAHVVACLLLATIPSAKATQKEDDQLALAEVELMEFEYQAFMGYHPCVFPMYGERDIPGSQADGQISVRMVKSGSEAVASLFYAYWDRHLLGRLNSNSTTGKREVFLKCDNAAIEAKVCTQDEFNHFLFREGDNLMVPGMAGHSAFALIKEDLNTGPTGDSIALTYSPSRKGIYCFMFDTLEAVSSVQSIEFDVKQPFGYLNAVSYPFLPFYATLSFAYLIIGVVWIVVSAMHWRDILPVQNYIAGLFLVLMVDYAFHYGFYQYATQNERPSMVLGAFSSIMNSLRNAASIFVLLLVSMGYGVVRPSLGSDMKKCIGISVALFVAFLILNFADIASKKQTQSPNFFAALLILLPVAICMTTSFYWILVSINTTIVHLETRRQMFKLKMYKWLKLNISVGIVAVFACTLLFGLILSWMTHLDAWARSWESLWFVQTGWMNILYLGMFLSMIILWRPTKNNARYGLEELPEDGDNFDLGLAGTFESFGNHVNNRRKSNLDSNLVFDADEQESASRRAQDVYAIGDDNVMSDLDDDEEYTEHIDAETRSRRQEQGKIV
eukprot:Partr_v1_DN25574_c0_g1_i2_m20877 putative Transmembrane protein 87A